MAIGHILRRRARHVLVPMLGALLIAYFGYHAIEGDRGLLAYLRLTQEIKKAEISRDLIQADRVQIERRVALLRPDGVDPDMLDERDARHAEPRTARRTDHHAAARRAFDPCHDTPLGEFVFAPANTRTASGRAHGVAEP